MTSSSDVLVLGHSAIARKRVLPALASLANVRRVHLASRRENARLDLPEDRKGTVFRGYDTALRSLHPCITYISLPNHLHAEWTRKALEAGFHVIVDKPAFLDLADAEAMVELAAARGLCLAEATVWPHHPQVSAAQEAFADAGTSPQSIQAAFSFPRPAPGNFRNDPSSGGGSFNDLCAYAVSPGRVFFGEPPGDIWCRVLKSATDTGIDTAFAIDAVYSGGRVFQGFFAFGTEYRNSMSLVGPGAVVSLDPVFTTQPHVSYDVRFRRSDAQEVKSVGPADSFAICFSRVIDSVLHGDWAEWPRALLVDATVTDRAATQAGVVRNAH